MGDTADDTCMNDSPNREEGAVTEERECKYRRGERAIHKYNKKRKQGTNSTRMYTRQWCKESERKTKQKTANDRETLQQRQTQRKIKQEENKVEWQNSLQAALQI